MNNNPTASTRVLKFVTGSTRPAPLNVSFTDCLQAYAKRAGVKIVVGAS